MSLDILAEEIIGKINAEQRDLLVTSKTDTDRLAKLIRDLLTLSRLEALPVGKLSEGKLNCNEVFDEIIRSMNQMFAEKGVELQANREDVSPIVIERSHFESILQNLLSNGLKFTPSGGKVSASMQFISNQLVIKVTDTGIGLRPEDKERIFDKFVQNRCVFN